MAQLQIQPLFRDEIAAGQQQDPEIQQLVQTMHEGRLSGFSMYDGILHFGSRLCVPMVGDLRNHIMTEAH
ncbi:hypothetical protein PJH61_29960, partial [Mycobacterium kansasii]